MTSDSGTRIGSWHGMTLGRGPTGLVPPRPDGRGVLASRWRSFRRPAGRPVAYRWVCPGLGWCHRRRRREPPRTLGSCPVPRWTTNAAWRLGTWPGSHDRIKMQPHPGCIQKPGHERSANSETVVNWRPRAAFLRTPTTTADNSGFFAVNGVRVIFISGQQRTLR